MKFIIGLLLMLFTTVTYAEHNKQLIFFFDSRCPHCHDMAPIITKIAKKYNLPLIGNSLDRRTIEGFPNALFDNRLTNAFKVKALPTVGGVDMNAKTLTIVAVGFRNEAYLMRVIEMWLKQDKRNAL